MADDPILPGELHPFVMKWGELGAAWGIGRSAARIHGLLLAAEGPLTAEDIADALTIARSNVSMSMKELRAVGLVETAPALGDRRTRYTPVADPYEMAARIAAWRKAREFDPAREALAEAAANATGAAGTRLSKLSDFAVAADRWHSQISSLPNDRLKAIMKAGGAIADLLPAKKKKKK